MGSYLNELRQKTTKMKAFIAAALLGAATALPAGVLVAKPVAAGYAQPDLAEPPVYAYNYGVADDYSGANFAQTEQRDGYQTSGSYTVNLPDGRVQTVNYQDNGDGIVQDVSYTGTPTYGPAPVAAKVVARPAIVKAVAPVAVARPVIAAAPVRVAPVVAARPIVAAHGPVV